MLCYLVEELKSTKASVGRPAADNEGQLIIEDYDVAETLIKRENAIDGMAI